MFVNTGSIICPYCDVCSWSGEVSFIKEQARKHIRDIHTLEEIRGYQGTTEQPVENDRQKRIAIDTMKESLPLILTLMNSKDFTTHLNNVGYQFDIKSVLDAFTCFKKSPVIDVTLDYKRLEFKAIITDEIKQAHRKKNMANKEHNIVDEYYYAGVYSGLMMALVKSNSH